MDQYAIVYFLNTNTEEIQALRKKYDPHWTVIPPHITLVSPFSNISEEQILQHVEAVTNGMKSFPVHLYGLLKTDDNLLFLLVKEGRDEIIEVHDRLYSEGLSSLEQKYIFDPHITLGELSIEIEEMDLDIHATFDRISLIKGDGVSPAKIIKTFSLK